MSTSDPIVVTENRLCVPGFGQPIDVDIDNCSPVLVGNQTWDWNADTLTIREACMLKLVEDITNKPNWWEKVKNPEIVAKWKKEALEMPWSEYRQYADFTEAMADAVSSLPARNSSISSCRHSVSRSCAEKPISMKPRV